MHCHFESMGYCSPVNTGIELRHQAYPGVICFFCSAHADMALAKRDASGKSIWYHAVCSPLQTVRVTVETLIPLMLDAARSKCRQETPIGDAWAYMAGVVQTLEALMEYHDTGQDGPCMDTWIKCVKPIGALPAPRRPRRAGDAV